MTLNGPALIFTVFLLFCRVGACLMIAPGIGNTQIPVQIRVFVVVAATLALAPMLLSHTVPGDLDPISSAKVIVSELLTGGLIGALARLFFSALETLAYAAASLLGLANPFGVEMEQGQSLPPLGTIITLGATAMVFVADFHWQIIIALIDSYTAVPMGAAFDARRSLNEVAGVLGQSFVAAARIASPFFLYSVIVNFAIALINRVTPQVSIFFIASPFVVGGGLMLFYFTVRGQISGFMSAFSAWLASG